MSSKLAQIISGRFSIDEKQVRNTIKLLDEGATIPFISRYRKEMTGSLDEVAITNIADEYNKLKELEQRKITILKTIEEQGKLTSELKRQIEETFVSTELEDLYLPYRPKRKTRASIAREKGLEPLAAILMKQKEMNISGKAAEFLSKDVPTVEDALQGARDIVAEWISENKMARQSMRYLFDREALITSRIIKGKEQEGEKYTDYFEFSEPLKRCKSHRMLAIRRGEKEGFLKVSIQPDEGKALEKLEELFLKGYFEVSQEVQMAIADSYKRLLGPSIETEFKATSKAKADEEAIQVFAENLRQLLLAPPLGQKRVLAIDPGYRTGCKIVCLDEQGNLLGNDTIYPHQPQAETRQAAKKLSSTVESYKIDAIAIGNGTASRETEAFVKRMKFSREVQVFVVSEAGASIYSASKVAREEFPQYDVTVRGAVSIGRRLMDPLAELVKIEPKSIGVGQYQHDVDQTRLAEGLQKVVESCVNLVGVNLNTASKHLLTFVSGLGPALAQNIVDYRKKNGAFNSRSALLEVPRMGAKAFEQSAGFLRIKKADNPLDDSAVHPESYHIVEKMAKDVGCTVHDLLKDETKRKAIDPKKYMTTDVGLPTLMDILKELAKPGLDPRSKIKVFEFSEDVRKIEDVKAGMILPGIVTNITNFGAFVDIGVKQDGLVHISQLADRYISDPNEIVKLHEHVKVKVLDCDVVRKRITLSMKEAK